MIGSAHRQARRCQWRFSHVPDQRIQVHGGAGFVEETGAAQYLRDARICPIYEGTTGSQAGDLLNRKVSRDAGACMYSLIADMRAELLRAAHDPTSSEALKAVDLLNQATLHAVRAHAQGAAQAQAIAVPYLMLCGVVIGGRLNARAHSIACQIMDKDRAFYAAKQQLARFYARHILPEADALARVIQFGAEAVLQADVALM